MTTGDPPQILKAHRAEQVFELAWADGLAALVPFHRLRCACPCAACIDEISGKKILVDENVPAEIAPTQLRFSGNYALKIDWSDGHNTGLYTWSFLHHFAHDFVA